MEKKPKDIPPPQENETPFQRFRRLAQRVVSVPKDKTSKSEHEKQDDKNN